TSRITVPLNFFPTLKVEVSTPQVSGGVKFGICWLRGRVMFTVPPAFFFFFANASPGPASDAAPTPRSARTPMRPNLSRMRFIRSPSLLRLERPPGDNVDPPGVEDAGPGRCALVVKPDRPGTADRAAVHGRQGAAGVHEGTLGPCGARIRRGEFGRGVGNVIAEPVRRLLVDGERSDRLTAQLTKQGSGRPVRRAEGGLQVAGRVGCRTGCLQRDVRVPDHHSPEPLPTHIYGRSEEAVGRGRGIRNLLVDRHGDVDCGAGLSLLLGLGR